MTTNNKKTIFYIIFCLLIVVFSLSFFVNNVFAQSDSGESGQRKLEIDYPDIGRNIGVQKPTSQTSLPEYIKYIFTFFIIISGFISIAALIATGYQYLTSSGSPEKLKSARERFINVLIGVILLLGSYIFLTIINPELVKIKIVNLRDLSRYSISPPEKTPTEVEDILERIKEMAQEIKRIKNMSASMVEDRPDSIEDLVNNIKTLTDKCDCNLTMPHCICSQYELGVSRLPGPLPPVPTPAPTSTSTSTPTSTPTPTPTSSPGPSGKCDCQNPSKPNCADLRDYNIPISKNSNSFIDPIVVTPIQNFDACVKNLGIENWYISEACPPKIVHNSNCHNVTGRCVDVNAKDKEGRSAFCSSLEVQDEIYKCAQEAGFTKIINECVKKTSRSTAPHFHLQML